MNDLRVFEPVQRIMVVTPHPDDAEFGCAGTIARMVRAGKEALLVVATSGDKGGRDTDISAEALRATRESEQRESAAITGYTEVVHLGFGDGELEDNREFRGALVYQIRRFKPDIVFTTDPFRTTFYIHRDHRMAGMVTLDAVFPYARDRLHFPEHIAQGLSGHNVSELYFWGSEDPDTFVDVTELVDLKVRALMAHRSQMGDWVEESGGEEGFARLMKRWGRSQARRHKLPYRYAEAFRRYGLRRMGEEFEGEDEGEVVTVPPPMVDAEPPSPPRPERPASPRRKRAS